MSENTENQIDSYIHCKACFEADRPSSNVEVGWTIQGFQVWCRECDSNIGHFNFEGQKISVVAAEQH